jgi:hypothetical protein
MKEFFVINLGLKIFEDLSLLEISFLLISIIFLLIHFFLKLHSSKNYRNPLISIISLALGVIFYSSFAILQINKDVIQRAKEIEPKGIETKIVELEKIQESLDNLKNFIEEQTFKLVENEKTINNLEQEKSRLDNVVTTDRKVVEAIFAIQEQRGKSQKWQNIFFGFISGIVASVIGSAIWHKLKD